MPMPTKQEISRQFRLHAELLLTLANVHSHTTWSDGIEECAIAAVGGEMVAASVVWVSGTGIATIFCKQNRLP